ncbi:hypothetical protein MA20_48540 [Bradyrhizobium japonicum]|uniref:ABM domain-containing protein n=1 Tax=Bradyrhizobium japonicum TaxID=375 RepID=A0A0A3XHI9_BRAJP|nr:hypothetical protein MA20_48540 [Bradyrhizobium japonicum]
MITVFIEYKLDERKRADFMNLIDSVEAQLAECGAKGYLLLEGMDQPGLVVETFQVETAEAYQAIREWRLADQTFCACIPGRAEKLHIWAFIPLVTR